MANPWYPPNQQVHQQHYPQPIQQPQHSHESQQWHQQPPYQQYSQNGQYLQASVPQYQQPAQALAQPQTYQQPQYSENQMFPQSQTHQQAPQQYPQAQQQYPTVQQHYQQQHPPTQQQYQQQYPSAQQHYQQQYAQAQQQYTQPHQQTHDGYYQQYAHQQYHSQQQTPTHYQTPNQPYQQQQVSPENAKVPPVVNATSCFNCGSPNHIAQDCTEPKRQVPAGAMDPRRYANPSKRAKSGGPIITKYLPPAHISQAQRYPTGYPPSGDGVSRHSQYNGTSAAVVHASAPVESHQQAWQQYYQWQAYQQSQQQSQQQGASQQSQSHSVPASQDTYANGYQQQSQTSPQAPYDATSSQAYQMHNSQMQASQPLLGTPTHAESAPHQAPNHQEMKTVPERSQSTSSISMESQSTSMSPQDTSIAQDLEEDNLNLLDVPDMPMGISEQGGSNYLQNTIVSPPASLISMPLPANFIVADALCPIPPPAPENEGRCQSKYLRDSTSETLFENIQSSKYWKDHKDDTAFLTIPNEDSVMPISELQAHLMNRRAGGDAKGETRSQSRGASSKPDPIDVLTNIEKLEREIAEMKAKMHKRSLAKGEQTPLPLAVDEASPVKGHANIKEESQSPPQIVTTKKKSDADRDTEDILAALGVTGSPKPISTTNGIHNNMQVDASHVWQESPVEQQREMHNNRLSSYSPGFGLPPPPPPPPPVDHSPWPEETDVSPRSYRLDHANSSAFDTNGTNNGNGYYNSGPDGEVISPGESRRGNLASRKRSYHHRSSFSDDDDAPARRQEDDVTPKLKRRQPKVAAAYSRRW